MKLLFCITALGHGKGGHFFSLRTIVETLSADHDVMVVNLGRSLSPVVAEGKYPLKYIPYHGWDYLVATAKFASLVRAFHPDVVHAFDVPAFGVARAVVKAPIKLALTQCGGPNPRKYYPAAQDLILFSQENYDFFSRHKRWRGAHLALVPNRVQPVQGDVDRVEKLRQKHALGQEKIILRISRICRHYQSSCAQGINLVAKLAAEGMAVRLLLLGVVQSPEVKADLQALIVSRQAENLVIWEDDKSFTDNAAELLPLADAVIGSGRGFMEAASMNKLLLAISAAGDYPIGVTEANFAEVFATNCSPRSQVANYAEEANLKWIASALQGVATVNSRQWFDTYFSAERVRVLYPEFYRDCTPRRRDCLDTCCNALYAAWGFK